jgi:hypothetical protein
MEPSGQTEERIPENAVLLRRIKADWARRDEHGQLKVKSIAFQDRKESGALSVARSDVLEAEGKPLSAALEGWEGYGLVAIPLTVLEELGLEVKPDPTRDDSSHTLVLGNKTGSIKKRLVEASEWVVDVPGV